MLRAQLYNTANKTSHIFNTDVPLYKESASRGPLHMKYSEQRVFDPVGLLHQPAIVAASTLQYLSVKSNDTRARYPSTAELADANRHVHHL